MSKEYIPLVIKLNLKNPIPYNSKNVDEVVSRIKSVYNFKSIEISEDEVSLNDCIPIINVKIEKKEIEVVVFMSERQNYMEKITNILELIDESIWEKSNVI